jgi:hypothetical protein
LSSQQRKEKRTQRKRKCEEADALAIESLLLQAVEGTKVFSEEVNRERSLFKFDII